MKRFFLILVIAGLLGSSKIMAQTKPFRFGIKVVPSVGWLKPQTEGYESEGAAAGFGWGFISDITLADNYFIATGFDMEWNHASLQYPHKVEGIDQEGTLHREYKLKYIDIPVSIKMRTNRFNAFSFFGQLGITAGFKLGAKSEDVFEYTDSDQALIMTAPDENEIGDEINVFRSFVLIGAGAEYFIDESTSLVASINFKNGITNILDGTNDVDPTVNEKANLESLQLTIGIIF
jgi:hypothetical protein